MSRTQTFCLTTLAVLGCVLMMDRYSRSRRRWPRT